MIFNQITRAHLSRLMKEDVGNFELFTKKMVARLRNENPNFPVFTEQLNRLVENNFQSRNIVFTKDHRNLVLYLEMVCFRVLEIAQLTGSTPVISTKEMALLMSNPDLDSNDAQVREAKEEAALLYAKLGVLVK